MKILKYIFIVVFTFCLGWTNSVFAQNDEGRINNFDVTIEVNSDSSVDIAETIEYDFGNLYRHGIYRDIILKYKTDSGNRNLRIKDIKVIDSSGVEYDFSLSQMGIYRRIKIGDADEYVTGIKTYVIKYKIEGAINYFEDYDEFYWNVTGNEWEVPILNSSAEIIFPQSINHNQFQFNCFAGSYGTSDSCTSYYYDEDEEYINSIDFKNSFLSSGEGLTISVAVPKGVMYEPTPLESLIKKIEDNLILFFPLLLFIYLFILWKNRGRDPKGRETIVTQFDVPKNITPAEVGTIVDEKCSHKEVTAEIINLAIKGYLKIERVEKKKIIGKKVDYIFKRIKQDYGELENKHEKFLFTGIFQGRSEMELSRLNKYFYDDYPFIKKYVYESVSHKGFFFNNPQKTRVIFLFKYSFIVIVLLVLHALVFNGFFTYIDFVIIAVSLILVFIFSFFMPRKTSAGVALREHILGLKEYISVAEKDRMKFHNAPEKSPQHFEKLLPFAIALGVEKEWAEQFKDIYANNPSWYVSSGGLNSFDSISFVNSLSAFSKEISFSPPANSASHGGSAFGGGGFSGGGFGGGGGGSW